MSEPQKHNVRLELTGHPIERNYLFWMEVPKYQPSGRLDIWDVPIRAMQMADYVFIRVSPEGNPCFDFKIYKSRSPRLFGDTEEFAWLKEQFPSMTISEAGIVRVTDKRDLALIKVMHGVRP